MTVSSSPAPIAGIVRTLALAALMGIAPAVPPGWAENILQITDFRITARMEEIADAVAGEEVGLNVFCTLDADQLAEQIPEGYTIKSRFSFWFPNGSAGTVIVPTGGSTGWTDEPIWWYYGACSFSGIGVQEVRVRAEVRVLNPQGAQVLELRRPGSTKALAVDPSVAEPGVLAIALGDDRTDEDLFGALPPSGLSIRVGQGPSRAGFRLGSVAEVRILLHGLAERLPGRLEAQP